MAFGFATPCVNFKQSDGPRRVRHGVILLYTTGSMPVSFCGWGGWKIESESTSALESESMENEVVSN